MRETKLNDDFFELIKKVDLNLVKESGHLYRVEVLKKTTHDLMFSVKYNNTNYNNNKKTIDEIFGKAYKNSKKGKFITTILDRVNNFTEYKKEKELEYFRNKLMCLKQNLKDEEQKVYNLIEEIEEVEYQLKLIDK